MLKWVAELAFQHAALWYNGIIRVPPTRFSWTASQFNSYLVKSLGKCKLSTAEIQGFRRRKSRNSCRELENCLSKYLDIASEESTALMAEITPFG